MSIDSLNSVKGIALIDKWRFGRYNKKNDINPTNLAQILMTSGDEKLPKYKLHVDKKFAKGFVTGLGHCYISVKTFRIRDLYTFDDIDCIKFEVTPFYSKTKLYKFMINSKDIKQYLNMDYPN